MYRLAGPTPAQRDAVVQGSTRAEASSNDAPALRETDGTEYMISAIVIGALVVLLLMKKAGFKAMVAVSAGKGGS